MVTSIRGQAISIIPDIEAGEITSAASLLFAPGARPPAAAIERLANENGGFSVSLDPAQSGAASDRGDWLELLVNGLTFDLIGLAPGPAAAPPPRTHNFGLDDGPGFSGAEAVTLKPGPHLASGAKMLPVVRSMAWLAAQLADLPGARAVAWHPAHSWSAPGHFRGSVLRWTEGGVFPGLGLAAFAAMPDGGLQSQGLALFTGQELRLEPGLADDRAAVAKIGLRLLHWLVEHGRLKGPESIAGPEGQPLRLEPSGNGRFVRVWAS